MDCLKYMLLLLLLLITSACSSDSTPTSPNDDVSINPTYLDSPDYLINEVLFTMSPYSVETSPVDPKRKTYRFRIPEEHINSSFSNTTLDGQFYCYMPTIDSLVIENQTSPDRNFVWYRYTEGGLIYSYPYYFMLPDTVDVEEFIDDGEIVVHGDHMNNPITLRVVKRENNVGFSPISTFARYLFHPVNQSITQCLIQHGDRIWELDGDGRYSDQWQGIVSESICDDTVLNGKLCFYTYEGTLYSMDSLDPAPIALATSDLLRFAGVEVIGDTLYAILPDNDDPRLQTTTRIYAYNVTQLLSTGTFESTPCKISNLSYALSGPLEATADGQLMGVSGQLEQVSQFAEGKRRIGVYLIDREGEPIGLWTLPFTSVRTLQLTATEFWVMPWSTLRDALHLSGENSSINTTQSIWILSIETIPYFSLQK